MKYSPRSLPHVCASCIRTLSCSIIRFRMSLAFSCRNFAHWLNISLTLKCQHFRHLQPVWCLPASQPAIQLACLLAHLIALILKFHYCIDFWCETLLIIKCTFVHLSLHACMHALSLTTSTVHILFLVSVSVCVCVFFSWFFVYLLRCIPVD